MKYNKAEKLIWVIFTIIGVAFIMIGSIVCASVFGYQGKVDTEGTITQIDTYTGNRGSRYYDVMVAYRVDGKDYESKLNGYSSSFYEGKKIDIYYDKDNPNKIGIKSMDLLFVLIFSGIGLLFVIIGGAGIIVKIIKKNSEKRLKANGELIYANYVETALNTAYSVNQRNPYYIICEWYNQADNKKYIFKSKNIWINPENTIQEKNIKQFPVYIGNNIKKYVVDIDILTKDIIDLR